MLVFDVSTDDSYGHESVHASQLTLNIDVGVPAGLVSVYKIFSCS